MLQLNSNEKLFLMKASLGFLTETLFWFLCSFFLVGYTYEETYVEADVVGFDETATQEQATGEQQTVIDLEQPSTQGEAGSREQYSFETPKQKMQERPHSGTNRRQRDNQRDNQRSSQRDAQREAQRDTQRDAQRDAQRDTQRDQNNGREQRDLREPNKDESNSLQANEFGVYSLGEKRLVDLSSLVLQHEKRFSGRARLFVANLATVVTEDDLKTLFGKFGETNEVYVNKDKGFGFVRLVSYRFCTLCAKGKCHVYFPVLSRYMTVGLGKI